jgi:hypothetical protein
MPTHFGSRRVQDHSIRPLDGTFCRFRTIFRETTFVSMAVRRPSSRKATVSLLLANVAAHDRVSEGSENASVSTVRTLRSSSTAISQVVV